MATTTVPGAAVEGVLPAGPAVLELNGAARRHADRPVLAPVDLSLDAGTLSVLTGLNGSGKTTLLRLAAGLLRPTAGARTCRGRALYVRAGAGLRSAQTVGDAVRTTAGLVGRREAAAGALALLDLAPLEVRRVGTLSAGERVRVTLAGAVAAGPALLCLDEPTGALDDEGLQTLRHVLEALRGAGCATLVATHQPDTLLPLADAHLRLSDGRLVRA